MSEHLESDKNNSDHTDSVESTQPTQVASQPMSAQSSGHKEPKASGGKGIAVIALLASLIALAGSGFTVYNSHFKAQGDTNKLLTGVNSIGGDVKVLAERVTQLQRDQQKIEQSSVSEEQLQTRLLEASNQSDLALRDIKQVQTTLQDAFTKVSERTERSADKFALEEVSQLLKLANNSAVFSNDKKAAITALRLADSQLKQLSDPRYAAVRRTINQEIGSLEASESVDVPTLTSKINLLSNRITSLPLENEPPVVDGQVKVVNEEPETELTASSELKKLWATVLDTVKIRRVDQPPRPLLEPEQRYFLDQNIVLKLNTAELAVLQTRPETYQRSIQDALAWLNEYYDPRDQNVKDVIAQLENLKSQSFGQDLPSIVGSYDALQRIKGGN